MASCFISRIVILIFGTLYPAYSSYKAVRTKNVKEYVKWMMYWIVFALFTCFETFTDLFLSFWFPFYYELKIITVIYLLSPATNGSSILYRKFVHPVLAKREQEIDEYITKAKEQGYHTMLNLGSKGVNYATSLIMQTAIKGGGGIVSHLKKSYSLSDLNQDQSAQHGRDDRDEVDQRHLDGYTMMRRSDGHTPRRMISGRTDSALYFPEVDAYQRPVCADEEYYGRMTYSEEVSSGYSSGDPLYSDHHGSQGEPLVRTASMGGTSRVRTRASAKNTLPKRSSISEGTWSPGEVYESQGETDTCFFLPLSHSSSVPVSLNPLSDRPNVGPRQMLGGLTREQLLALLGATRLPPLYRTTSESFPHDYNTDSHAKQVPGSAPVIIGEVTEENADQVSESRNSEEISAASQQTKDASSNATNTNNNNNGESNVPATNDTLEFSLSENRSPLDKIKKHTKRPAPAPPVEGPIVNKDDSSPVQEAEEEFSTPNSSPKPQRKLSSSYSNLVEQIDEDSGESTRVDLKTRQHLEVPKKTKSKSKKISKKLHLPKFPFWNPKSGKLSSGSENSSVASNENIAVAAETSGKNSLEYFIPLKGECEGESDACK